MISTDIWLLLSAKIHFFDDTFRPRPHFFDDIIGPWPHFFEDKPRCGVLLMIKWIQNIILDVLDVSM